MKNILLIAFLFSGIAFFSCKKDSFTTSKEAFVILSSDSLYFDTVFTTAGSVTQALKITNNNEQKLRLNTIQLVGGNASPFKINIDGAPVSQMNNIELEANDSMYVFVTVSVQATGNNLPFIVQDYILISYNGNTKYVKLSAWGQNAHFLNNEIINTNTVWKNDLPYVIIGGLEVKENATLTIEKGCRIYVRANSPVLVDGSLKVFGEKYDSTRVIFSGDRLDEPYKNYPGSWPGIYFRETSKNNELHFTTIKNAYQGLILQQQGSVSNPVVTLDACILDNISDAGIIATKSSLVASNCLLSNCGKSIFVEYGGNYSFTHCTMASVSNMYVPHLNPAITLSNSYSQNGNMQTGDLSASFLNCIIWGESGSINDEVTVTKQGNNAFNINFTNCLWKEPSTPSNVTAVNVFDAPPLFDSINATRHYYNFRLKENSPAIDKGSVTGLIYDLDGNVRAVNAPDLGCYERQ